jgi:hypothetical protein
VIEGKEYVYDPEIMYSYPDLSQIGSFSNIKFTLDNPKIV